MKLQTRNTIRAMLGALLIAGAGTAFAGTCTAPDAAGSKLAGAIKQRLTNISHIGLERDLGLGKHLKLTGVMRVDNFKERRGLLNVRKLGKCMFEASFSVTMTRKIGKTRHGRLIIPFLEASVSGKDRKTSICYLSSYVAYEFKWAKGAPIVTPDKGKRFALAVSPNQKICFSLGDDPHLL